MGRCPVMNAEKGDVMDIQLQELLEKIKKEGVEAAKAQADQVLSEAETKRKAILAEAEAQATAIVKKAEADARRLEEGSKAALAQVSRDSLLAFKSGLEALLGAAMKAELGAAYGPEVLAEAISVAVKALASGKTEDLTVLLPPALLSKVEAKASSLLAKELLKGTVIKASSELSTGFRIVEKDGAAYYDFSAESLAEIFSTRLNSRLAESLRAAAKGL